MNDQATRVRLTNTLFATQSLFAAAQIAIFTLMSIVAVELSGQESAAGVPTTTLTLSQSLAALPIGVLMGRIGRRLGLSISYGVSVLGALIGVIAIAQGLFWLLLVSAMLIGMGRAGGDQGRYAAGDMFEAGMRARMIGRVVFAGTIGAIVGPVLVGPSSWLATQSGLPENTGPWMLGTIIYAIAGLIIFIKLHPDPMQLAVSGDSDEASAEKPAQPAASTSDRTTGQLLRVPHIQLAVAAMLISQGVMTALMVITPVHMTDHSYVKADVGIVIMAHTLGMFGLSSLTGYLIDRFGAINVMILAAVTLALAAIVAPLSTAFPFLIVGLFLLGLGWNFGYIAGSTLLSANLRGMERARMQGTSDMLVAGAAAIGSLSSGPLFSVGDYRGVAIAVIVAVLLLGWLIYLWGLRRAEKPKVSPQVAEVQK